MNVHELRADINKGALENIYLFSGSEVGEKKEIIELLTKKVFGSEVPIVYTFYCDKEFDPADFNDTLNAGLLFSDRKMIILKNIEQADKTVIKVLQDYIIPRSIEAGAFEGQVLAKSGGQAQKLLSQSYKKDGDRYLLSKVKESDKNSLVSALDSSGYPYLNPENYLVLINETTDKIPDAISRLFTPKQNVVFWEMFDNKKIDWVRDQFKGFNLFIEEDAVAFLLDTIENNKDQLMGEINKIAVSFSELGKGEKVVPKAFIEDYLFHSKEESAFTLFSALMNRNLEKAMDILEKVFMTEEMTILNGIIWSQRRFLKALDLYYNQKLPVNEIFKALFINGKKNQEELKVGLKNFSFEHGCFMFYHLSELDYDLRVLPPELKLIRLQEFIFRYLGGSRRKSFLQGDLQSLQF